MRCIERIEIMKAPDLTDPQLRLLYLKVSLLPQGLDNGARGLISTTLLQEILLLVCERGYTAVVRSEVVDPTQLPSDGQVPDASNGHLPKSV